MKKTNRLMAVLMSAMMTAALPVGTFTHAEDAETVTENYKGMTLEEAVLEMTGGDYLWLAGKRPVLRPIRGFTGKISTVTADNKTHNLEAAKAITSIRMKAGKELPYDDIKAAVEAEGLTMPVIQKNGKDYEIISSISEKAYNFTLDQIKACPDVTAIDMKYKLFEDRANKLSIYSLQFENVTEEEISEKYPELKKMGNDSSYPTEENALYYTFDNDKLYDIIGKLTENGTPFTPCWSQTELGMRYEYVYCHEPVLIDTTPGDANIDGYVDVSDSVMIMQSLANPNKYGLTAENGITEQGRDNADTDEDGLTNTDALNIQKSLLGMGDIPIPPKDADIDFVSYDPIDFTEERLFRSMTMNGIDYWVSYVPVKKDLIGEELGEFTATGHKTDSISETETVEEPVTVYEMKGYAVDAMVAFRFKDSNNYYVFRNPKYLPKTVGELIEGMQLDEQLIFNRVYINKFKPYETADYDPDRAVIWDALFGDKDIEIMELNDMNRYNNITHVPRPDNDFQLSIGCDMPITGKYNFGFTVYSTGFVTTNLVDYGLCFKISPEKAQALMEHFDK